MSSLVRERRLWRLRPSIVCFVLDLLGLVSFRHSESFQDRDHFLWVPGFDYLGRLVS